MSRRAASSGVNARTERGVLIPSRRQWAADLPVPGGVAVTGAEPGRQTPCLFIAAAGNQDGRSGNLIDPDERVAGLGQPLDCFVVVGVSADDGLRRVGESEMSSHLQEFDVPDPVVGMPVEEVAETPGENQDRSGGSRRPAAG